MGRGERGLCVLPFFHFDCSVNGGLDNGQIILRAYLQLVADTLPLLAVSTNQTGIEVAFRRQTANPYKLHCDRDARNCFAQFDIRKIAGRDVYYFRQCLTNDSLGLTSRPYIFAKGFKSGAVFDICHFISPKDIV